MLVVTTGKLVIGFEVFAAGEAIEGLDPETERNLVAAGLAKRADGEPAGPEEAGGEDEPLSFDELKARCRDLGLSARGKKADLEARIAEAEATEREADGAEGPDGDEPDGDEPPVLSAEVPR